MKMGNGITGPLMILIMVSVIIASGCVSNQPIDCGSDETCFYDATASCSPATVETVMKEDMFVDLKARYVINATVKGKEGSKCAVEASIITIEMTGNLTGAPSRLLYLLYASANSPAQCSLNDLYNNHVPMELDLEGILEASDRCSGSVIGTLEEALTYKEGPVPTVPAKKLETLQSYCVGGKNIVAYIRNIGTDDINLSEEVKLLYASNGTEIDVGWLDFSGNGRLEMLFQLKMAQFQIPAIPGTLYELEVEFDSQSYPISTQC